MVADGSQSGYVRAATSELHGNERSPSSSLSGVMGVLRRRRRLRLSRQTAPDPLLPFAYGNVERAFLVALAHTRSNSSYAISRYAGSDRSNSSKASPP